MQPCAGLMVEVLAHKKNQASTEGDHGGYSGQRKHLPNFGTPLIIHSLSDLLEGQPGIIDVTSEDIRIESHQVLGEINQEQSADSRGDSRTRTANQGRDQKAVEHEGAQRNPTERG